MKKFLLILAFAGTAFTFVSAQNNGNGCGNSQGQNSSQIPFGLTVHILHQAFPTFQAAFGINFGQFLLAYRRHDATIELVSVDTATGLASYRVQYGGIGVIVIDDAY